MLGTGALPWLSAFHCFLKTILHIFLPSTTKEGAAGGRGGGGGGGGGDEVSVDLVA